MKAQEMLDDIELSAFFCEMKLERRASWLEMRAVARMLSGVRSDWLAKSTLPTELIGVRPLEPSHRFVDMPTGLHFQPRRGDPQQVIPAAFDPSQVLVLGHCIDRGSTGCSAISCIVDEGSTLTLPAWGVYHDGWNSVRPVMKKIANGSCWKAILRLAGIGNLPHGPYRSGAWGRLLTELQCRCCEEMSPQSMKFQRAMQRKQLMYQSRTLCLSAEWLRFCGICIFTGDVGTTLKFSRWFSVSQRWLELREDYWYIEVVYEKAAFHSGGDASGAIEYTSLWDADTSATTSGSRLQTTVTYFSDDHARTMDAYQLSMSWLSKSHFTRMQSHLSIEQHIEDLNNRRWGLWADEIENMLSEAIIRPDADMLNHAVPALQNPRESKYAHRLLELTVTVIAEWLKRTVPLAVSYPDAAAMCLAPGLEEDGVETMAMHAQWLLDLEQMAADGSERARQVLQDIGWLSWTTNRLLLFLARQQVIDKAGDRVQRLARACVSRLPDERVPEDCHQKVRDFQRTQRRRSIGSAAVWDKCVKSNLLETRKIATCEVPDHRLAEEAFER